VPRCVPFYMALRERSPLLFIILRFFIGCLYCFLSSH
jgi:hypothetical protein